MKRPRRAFVLALLAACGAGASASTRSSTEPSQDPDGLEGAAQAGVTDEGTQHASCLVRSQRSFIGFSEGMSLDDFDVAATEAKQVMALAEDMLCQQANALEPSGKLARDLAAHQLTLFEVRFVRDDASAADIGLRRLDAPDTDERGDYRVAAEHDAEQGWRLVGVTLR
jgi:hypothetical protein